MGTICTVVTDTAPRLEHTGHRAASTSTAALSDHRQPHRHRNWMRRLDAAPPSTAGAPACDAAGMVEWLLLVVAVLVVAGIAQWWSLR